MKPRKAPRTPDVPATIYVPGVLVATLDRPTGELSIEYRDQEDRTEEIIERGLAHRERCITPSAHLVERLKLVDPYTGMRRK